MCMNDMLNVKWSFKIVLNYDDRSMLNPFTISFSFATDIHIREVVLRI